MLKTMCTIDALQEIAFDSVLDDWVERFGRHQGTHFWSRLERSNWDLLGMVTTMDVGSKKTLAQWAADIVNTPLPENQQ